ncbi:MAG: hypothetical protein B7X95_05330, partial [Methylophilaceae bacterium 17-44-8]
MISNVNNRVIIVFLIIASCILSACVSGYKQFYTPAEGLTQRDIDRLNVAIANKKEPIVEYSSSRDA